MMRQKAILNILLVFAMVLSMLTQQAFVAFAEGEIISVPQSAYAVINNQYNWRNTVYGATTGIYDKMKAMAKFNIGGINPQFISQAKLVVTMSNSTIYNGTTEVNLLVDSIPAIWDPATSTLMNTYGTNEFKSVYAVGFTSQKTTNGNYKIDITNNLKTRLQTDSLLSYAVYPGAPHDTLVYNSRLTLNLASYAIEITMVSDAEKLAIINNATTNTIKDLLIGGLTGAEVTAYSALRDKSVVDAAMVAQLPFADIPSLKTALNAAVQAYLLNPSEIDKKGETVSINKSAYAVVNNQYGWKDTYYGSIFGLYDKMKAMAKFDIGGINPQFIQKANLVVNFSSATIYNGSTEVNVFVDSIPATWNPATATLATTYYTTEFTSNQTVGLASQKSTTGSYKIDVTNNLKTRLQSGNLVSYSVYPGAPHDALSYTTPLTLNSATYAIEITMINDYDKLQLINNATAETIGGILTGGLAGVEIEAYRALRDKSIVNAAMMSHIPFADIASLKSALAASVEAYLLNPSEIDKKGETVSINKSAYAVVNNQYVWKDMYYGTATGIYDKMKAMAKFNIGGISPTYIQKANLVVNFSNPTLYNGSTEVNVLVDAIPATWDPATATLATTYHTTEFTSNETIGLTSQKSTTGSYKIDVTSNLKSRLQSGSLISYAVYPGAPHDSLVFNNLLSLNPASYAIEITFSNNYDLLAAFNSIQTIGDMTTFVQNNYALLGLQSSDNASRIGIALLGETVSTWQEVKTIAAIASKSDVYIAEYEQYNATTATGSFKIKNLTGEQKPVQIVIASYGASNEMLQAIIVPQSELAAMSVSNPYVFTFTNRISDIKEICVYAWNDLYVIKPYTGVNLLYSN